MKIGMMSAMLAWFLTLFLTLMVQTARAQHAPQKIYDLDEVIALAMARNPIVAGAQGAVEQSIGQRIAANAYPNPTITGYGGYGVLKDGGRTAVQAIEEPARQQLGEYNGSIGQPVEWPAKRGARKRAAEAALAGANVALAETQLYLTADVKIAFYEVLLAQRAAELARQNLEIVGDVHRIVAARVRLGESPQFEAIKADVEVLKAKQMLRRAENSVRVNRVVLDTLTAGALGWDYAITGEFEAFPTGLDIAPLVHAAVETHPGVKRLAKFIERAGYSVELERQTRIPNVTVTGSYIREIGREAVLAGFSVPAPLWYQRQGEIAEALGVKRREEAELIRVRNLLIKEVNQHYQDARTTADLIDVFETGLLRQAREALRIAQFSFQQGATSLLEVLDAQRVLRQILVDYAQARFDLSVSVARLERAVGREL